MCECLHYADGDVYLCPVCAVMVRMALELGAQSSPSIRDTLRATWGLPEDRIERTPRPDLDWDMDRIED
jgi:hypothetical protein